MSWGWGGPWGRGVTFPASDPKRRIDHVLTDLWPTGPDGLPLTDEAAAAGESPLLRAVDWGTASFIISDHVGTWGGPRAGRLTGTPARAFVPYAACPRGMRYERAG